MSETNKKNKIEKPDEIDIVGLFRKVWDNRNTVFKSIAFFFALGLVAFFLSPKEYKSEVVLLVETSNSSSGMSGLLQQFGGLAGLGNMGAGITEDALTPDLYPDIIKSVPFLLGILNAKITDSQFDSAQLVSTYIEHNRKSLMQVITGNTIGLPGKFIGLFKTRSKESGIPVSKIQSGPLKLTPRQNALSKRLSRRIKAEPGESTGTFVISVEMQDPQVAAQLVDSVVKSLTGYIIEYRTQKSRNDLRFIEQSHYEAEKKYARAQQVLAAFKDRNMNIVSASAQITEQNMQAEYTLAFNLYNTLSQQLEQAKLKVQEKTPVFTVVNPAVVPLQSSKPNTSIILMAMVFLGVSVGVGIILGKTIYNNIFN